MKKDLNEDWNKTAEPLRTHFLHDDWMGRDIEDFLAEDYGRNTEYQDEEPLGFGASLMVFFIILTVVAPLSELLFG